MSVPTTPAVFLAGTGTWLAERRDVRDAVAAGEYARDDADKAGYESICVSGDREALDMGVAAARRALSASGLPPSAVTSVLYSHIHRQGPQLWSTGSYLQRELGIGGAFATTLEQGCNGGMAALELAVRQVQADPDAVVLTATADRFAPPDFDRWNGDYGIVYGDAGTAAVVSRRPGVARVLSVRSVTEPRLEEMHRGVGGAIGPVAEPVVLAKPAKKDFLAAYGGREHVNALSRAAIEPLLARVLAEAETSVADVKRVVLANLGRTVVEPLYLPILGIGYESTLWELGRRTGHLGTGDMVAGVDQALAGGLIGSGDRVLLLGAGAGYSWSCAVLEIV